MFKIIHDLPHGAVIVHIFWKNGTLSVYHQTGIFLTEKGFSFETLLLHSCLSQFDFISSFFIFSCFLEFRYLVGMRIWYVYMIIPRLNRTVCAETNYFLFTIKYDYKTILSSSEDLVDFPWHITLKLVSKWTIWNASFP